MLDQQVLNLISVTLYTHYYSWSVTVLKLFLITEMIAEGILEHLNNSAVEEWSELASPLFEFTTCTF